MGKTYIQKGHRLYRPNPPAFCNHPAGHANPVSALHCQKSLAQLFLISVQRVPGRTLQRLFHVLCAHPEACFRPDHILLIPTDNKKRRSSPYPHLFYPVRIFSKFFQNPPYSFRKYLKQPAALPHPVHPPFIFNICGTGKNMKKTSQERPREVFSYYIYLPLVIGLPAFSASMYFLLTSFHISTSTPGQESLSGS